MPKKLVKLALVLSIVAASLSFGLPKPAQAAGFCSDECCDASCTSVRHCFRAGGSCICEEFCTFE